MGRVSTCGVLIALTLSACSSSGRQVSGIDTSATTSSTNAATTSTLSPVAAWSADLDELDRQVRDNHPDPFAIHPESAWVAKIAELKTSLPTLEGDARMMAFASLVALLDTHSSFDGLSDPDGVLLFRFYDLYTNGFSDGTFVVRAADASLIGDRVVSIGGTPIEDVVKLLWLVLPADNPTGKQNAIDNWLTSVEYLHGMGIIDDVDHPDFVLARPDGTQITVNPSMAPDESAWETAIGFPGKPPGTVPEAVARRTEPFRTQEVPGTSTFLISMNDYDAGLIIQGMAKMKASLDAGATNRVVLDMRYLPGGNLNDARPLYDALISDPRINRPGGLVVMTGRLNESAATALASDIAHHSAATFVGEPTPARADNFLCTCTVIKLPNSGFTVRIPTQTLHRNDPAPSISPATPYTPSAADYFAGRDALLDAVLHGAAA